MDPFSITVVSGTSPLPDHLSFHTSTIPEALGLPSLTSYHC